METSTGAAARQAVIDDTALGGRDTVPGALGGAPTPGSSPCTTPRDVEHPGAPQAALLAIGGYGRGELAPFSDLDLLLVHDIKAARVEPFASAIWYPVWDAGSKLGHAVRTVDEQVDLAKNDLDTATALLTARLIAGDAELAAKVIDAGLRQLDEALQALARRAAGSGSASAKLGAGEVAYMLEPDLKDGHGGLRDVQSLWWAAHGGLALPSGRRRRPRRVLRHAAAGTGRAAPRHRPAGRRAAPRGPGRGGRPIAGTPAADALMADVAAAARTIAWIADEAWGRFERPLGGEPDRGRPGS